jgi:hypothetical protein
MKKIALALLGFLTINTTQAAELSLIGHGFSKHLDNHNFNERDYGAALRYESGEYALQAGGYHNSIRNNTAYAGFDWSPIHFNVAECLNVSAGLYVGGATGYKYTVTPMAGVQAAARCKNVFVRARAMPDVFYNSKAVGAIEIGFVLKTF